MPRSARRIGSWWKLPCAQVCSQNRQLIKIQIWPFYKKKGCRKEKWRKIRRLSNQKRYFCVFFDLFIHKSLPKTWNSKNNKNYEVFHKSANCFNIQLGVEKYFSIFRFCFWPLFVTKNSIFVFFDLFMHKSLPKTQKSKNNENYEVFHKSTKYFNIQLGVDFF